MFFLCIFQGLKSVKEGLVPETQVNVQQFAFVIELVLLPSLHSWRFLVEVPAWLQSNATSEPGQQAPQGAAVDARCSFCPRQHFKLLSCVCLRSCGSSTSAAGICLLLGLLQVRGELGSGGSLLLGGERKAQAVAVAELAER